MLVILVFYTNHMIIDLSAGRNQRSLILQMVKTGPKDFAQGHKGKKKHAFGFEIRDWLHFQFSETKGISI